MHDMHIVRVTEMKQKKFQTLHEQVNTMAYSFNPFEPSFSE